MKWNRMIIAMVIVDTLMKDEEEEEEYEEEDNDANEVNTSVKNQRGSSVTINVFLFPDC
ncbi:expressed protein [Phakopsora pachyrhizi]|uniref:Expressed protein n=1 Tax=Phakopsora pachyrhizi TaxID=170000 RepID=A0AAV0BNS2_PHAPC|nr:expressed protein [Phakopsora pachyrhizi]